MSEADKAAWIAARVGEIQAAVNEAWPPAGLTEDEYILMIYGPEPYGKPWFEYEPDDPA